MKASFVNQVDPNFLTLHPTFDPQLPLLLDINLKTLVRITDLYKNGSIYYQTLSKGTNTASPYSDCIVSLKVRIEVDNKEMFCHPNPLEVDLKDSTSYDLEQYELPAAIRKILKKTKLYEIVVVSCKEANHPKLIDQIPDPNNIFRAEWLCQANVRITLTLLDWQQKDYIFKIPVADKIKRVTFLKDVSAKCFKAEKFDKACKIYKSIKKFFDSKDVRNNFCKEDE